MGRKHKKSLKQIIEELKEKKQNLNKDISKYGAYLHSIKTLGRARVFENKKRKQQLKKWKIRYY